jgi:hypothetical protein
MSDQMRDFFKKNPQVLILLIICVVLGLGTFIAVIIALITAPSETTNGEPSDLILPLHAMLSVVSLL